MDLIKKILKGQMLLFSHFTRLEPGTDERKKTNKNWAMFYYKKSSWMILEKYLPSSTYYLERKEKKKMIAPLLLACAKW